MATAQDVINRARELINDVASDFVSGLRWSDTELLMWLTDGQREIVQLKPEAYVVTDVFEVEGGKPRQRLDPDAAYRLIRVEANGLAEEEPEPDPEPESPINLNDHEINSYGTTGTGSQEPKVTIYFGIDEEMPDGRFVIVGGSGAGSGSLEVDGNAITDQGPIPFVSWQYTDDDEWCTEAVDPSDYEVRLTVVSGEAPDFGTEDTWQAMDTERSWGIQRALGVAGGPTQFGAEWLFEIRDAETEQVLDSGTMTISLGLAE